MPLSTVSYILREILHFSNTLFLLALGFILPEIQDGVKSFGMGVDFDPARDIGSLEGKVILVTGGTALTPSQHNDWH